MPKISMKNYYTKCHGYITSTSVKQFVRIESNFSKQKCSNKKKLFSHRSWQKQFSHFTHLMTHLSAWRFKELFSIKYIRTAEIAKIMRKLNNEKKRCNKHYKNRTWEKFMFSSFLRTKRLWRSQFYIYFPSWFLLTFLFSFFFFDLDESTFLLWLIIKNLK